MEYTDFIEAVKDRCQFPTDGEASSLSRAVLEILGRRLTGEQLALIADYVPDELRDCLSPGGNVRYRADQEFIEALGERAGIDPTAAGYQGRAVLSVLASAIPTDVLRELLIRTPEDIRGLFMVETWVRETPAGKC